MACGLLLAALPACGGGDGGDAGDADADTQTVEANGARLEVARTSPAGSPVEVTWSGPDESGDYISIAAEGAPGGSTEDWTRTRNGSPLTVRPPDTPGAFEVRYVMGQSDRVIARSELEVTPVEASLESPDTLMVDTPVEIAWSGPANPGDYIAWAERGTPGGSTVNWTRTNQGSPLSLRTPEHPGRYELRYVMGQADRVLTRKTVTVLPLQARLDAPDTVPAGRQVEVSWLGPNGPDDFVALAVPDAAAGEYESRALTRAGDPAAVFAPSAAGTYELRYVWMEADSVLTRRTLVVAEP